MVSRSVTRRPQHTGEHVAVEPLARFLARPHEPRQLSLARKTWRPSLSDYDRGRLAEDQEEAA